MSPVPEGAKALSRIQCARGTPAEISTLPKKTLEFFRPVGIRYGFIAGNTHKDGDPNMKSVNIWFLTDNTEGAKLAQAIKGMGLTVHIVKGAGFASSNIAVDDTNLFIVDVKKKKLPAIVALLRDDPRLNSFLKFVITSKRDIRKAVNISLNMMHIEFIARPVDNREFSLLLEKSVVVEKYKEMMKMFSKEAETRIGAFESLMDINRKEIFENDREKEAFEKILDYERHLVAEQSKLNNAIKEFTLLRQKDLFDLKNRVKAEEMLTELRRLEMMDAQSVIKAQEAVIDFSAQKIDEAGKIINATEKVQELSRKEAMELHEKLSKAEARCRELEKEVDALRAELRGLRGQ